jgi:chromosome segregation ATPase
MEPTGQSAGEFDVRLRWPEEGRMPPAPDRPDGANGPPVTDDEGPGPNPPVAARRPRLPPPAPGGPDRDGPTDVADTLSLRLEAITLRLEGLRAASTSHASAVTGALREQANTIDRLTEEMGRLSERQRVAGADLAEQIGDIDDRLSKVTLSLASSPHFLDDLSDSISDELARRVSDQMGKKLARRLGRSETEQRELLAAATAAAEAAGTAAQEAEAATLAARQLARAAIDGLNSFGAHVLDALEERYGVHLDADGGGVAQSAFPRLADGVTGLTAELRELRDDVADFVESEAGRGSAQMQSLGDGIATMITEIGQLQADVAGLAEARADRSGTAIAGMAGNVTALKGELRQLHGDVAELADAQATMGDAAVAAVAGTVATLGTDLRQLQGDVAELGEALAGTAEASEAAMAGVAENVAALTAELQQLRADMAELAEVADTRGRSGSGAPAGADADAALAGLQAELVAIRRRLPVRGREPVVTVEPGQFDALVDAIIERLVSIADVVQVPAGPAAPDVPPPRSQVDGAAPALVRRARRPGS